MNTTEDPPPTVGAANPALANLAAKLAAKGLEVVPASELERPTYQVEDGLEAAARKAARVNQYQNRWQARLPAMYAGANLSDLDAGADTPGEARKVLTWLVNEGSLTLVLAGPVGVGKTHAAYAIGNTAVARGIWTEAWTVTDLLEALRPGGDPAVARDVARCDLLVLDDLGVSKVTDWAVDQVTSLMDTRIREGRRQIITTNAPYEVITEEWGHRLADRLAYRWTVVSLTGPSRRKGW